MNLPIKESLKATVYGYLKIRYRRREPFHPIFLISHMRAGSSLLTHILTSHSEIFGYGETHIRYTSAECLDELAAKVALVKRQFFGFGDEPYLLDKILHNDLLSPDQVGFLPVRDLHAIFLLRKPANSVSSMIRTFEFSREAAIDYYCRRLEAMTLLFEKFSSTGTVFALSYENLVSKPDECLTALTKYLSLKSPLSPNYEVSRITGRRGIGDSGPNIYSGHIIKGRQSGEMETGDSPGDLRRAEALYEDLGTRMGLSVT